MTILYRSAFELAEDIKGGKLKSVEVLDFFLDRVERFNGDLNVVVQLDVDRARKRANEADAAAERGENWGPLHGVPLTIKDAYVTEGIISVDGIPEYKDYVPTKNADGVQRYIDAGAIVFGKTNVPFMSADFQSYNEVYGTSNNPWDLSRTCGGSSGGAAASIAAGITPLEFGSDIGGSIRIPAHFNGIFGHKPSWGIVSQRGHIPGQDALGEGDLWVPGPLALNANDLEKAFDLLLGPPADRALAWKIELPEARTKDVTELKVATYFDDPLCEIDDESRTLLEGAAKSLEKAGARVSWKTCPDIDFRDNHAVYLSLLTCAMSVGMPAERKQELLKIIESADDQEAPEVLQAKAAFMTHEDWVFLNQRRLVIRAKWTEFFRDHDVLLAPVAALPAIAHDHTEPMESRVLKINGKERSYMDLVYWAGFSLVSHLPASVSPAGRTSANLPVGIQIVGPYLEDRTTLAVAKMLEEHHRGFEPPPGYE